jgi:uncharacterized protein
MIRRWRRLDEVGLEVLRLRAGPDGMDASSTVVHAGAQPFGLSYTWMLDAAWRTRTLRLDARGEDDRSLTIERTGPASWRVDGEERPDLDGCDEIDVSATPFCNSLAIRGLDGASGELTTLYVAVPEMSVTPSRQRYDALAPDRWRYMDLGVARGYEAVLDLDTDGLVARYEGLFEVLSDAGSAPG